MTWLRAWLALGWVVVLTFAPVAVLTTASGGTRWAVVLWLVMLTVQCALQIDYWSRHERGNP